LKTLPINFLLKDSPTAVAILDTDMRFINHSKIWYEQFSNGNKTLLGKSFYETLPDTSDELRTVYKACLKGNFNENDGQKFILKNGKVQWVKWKINPWKDQDDQRNTRST
jgi:PAS domain S-box-containing protein